MKRKTMTSPLPAQQKGVAALMFVLMLPALLAILALGIDGGGFLRAKAHIGDAAEVASLALSARDSRDNVQNKILAEAYIKALVPKAQEVSDIKITRRGCEEIPDCIPDGSEETPQFQFFEYQVEATVTQASLLPGFTSSGVGFEKEVSTRTKAVSRKYMGSAVDVVLVADFSGSMNDYWDGQTKIAMLKEVVTDVSLEIEKYSKEWKGKNTIALVPFNYNTVDE